MIPNQSILAVVLASLAVPVACAQTADPEPAPKQPAPVLPAPPQVRLYPDGASADEALDAGATAARANELVTQADAATNRAARCQLLLAAANEMLAHRLAPACTARFLGIKGGRVPPDRELQESLDRADDLLAKVEATLESDDPTGDLQPPESEGQRPDVPSPPPSDEGSESLDVLSKSRRQLDTLRAFSQALGVYLLPGGQPDAAGSARRAASRLSPLLEDGNVQVAAAATLWQACLRSRSDDPSRVMSLLPLAVQNLPRKTLPFAFYARLLRCRVLASSDGYAAALALLLQMEERCDAWFPNDTRRSDAVRTIALVRIRILGDWFDSLPEAADAAVLQWLVDRIDALKRERFPDDHQTVLQLSPAVPLIAEPPTPANETPRPTTTP